MSFHRLLQQLLFPVLGKKALHTDGFGTGIFEMLVVAFQFFHLLTLQLLLAQRHGHAIIRHLDKDLFSQNGCPKKNTPVVFFIEPPMQQRILYQRL